MWFTRISFCYLLTCCQGGLKTCFVFLSSLSISYDLLFQSRLYKSANNNFGLVKAGRLCRLACWYPRESNCSDKSYLHIKFYQGRIKFDQVIRFSLLLAGLLDGRYSVGRFGWLAGSYLLDSFPCRKFISPKLPFQILSKSDENCRFYSRLFGHYHRVFSEKRRNVETL